MTKYQAIVFDLDGTAIPNSRTGMPSKHLLSTVAKYRNRLHLVAATGRPFRQAMPVITALQLTNPCIISGGTIIIDPVTRAVIKHTNLPTPGVHAILRLLKNHPYRVTLRDESVDPANPAAHQTLIENVEIIYVSQVPGSEIPSLKQALEQIPDIAAAVVPDWSGNHYAFTITHRNATKEHAVAEVLRRLSIPQELAIGIGDGDNDLHLFASVGLKIAMGNAGPALLAAADIIAPSQEEDGLADIIKRYARK